MKGEIELKYTEKFIEHNKSIDDMKDKIEHLHRKMNTYLDMQSDYDKDHAYVNRVIKNQVNDIQRIDNLLSVQI